MRLFIMGMVFVTLGWLEPILPPFPIDTVPSIVSFAVAIGAILATVQDIHELFRK